MLWVEIRTFLRRHLSRFLARCAPHAILLAIVKANAYGHSLELCAPLRCVRVRSVGRDECEEAVARVRFALMRDSADQRSVSGAGCGCGGHKLTSVAWEPWAAG